MILLFMKQKTAYEMRSSDWSSDVCSSDLGPEVWLLPSVPTSTDLMQPRLGDPTQAQVTDSSAARRALSAALARRVGTIVLATTSVRLCVAPPARKKRRRTRPRTSSSCPEGHSSAAGGASNQATGTDSAGPPSGLTLSSSARTVSPAGKVRASGARVRFPTRLDRLVPAAGRVMVSLGSSDEGWRVEGGRALTLRPPSAPSITPPHP